MTAPTTPVRQIAAAQADAYVSVNAGSIAKGDLLVVQASCHVDMTGSPTLAIKDLDGGGADVCAAISTALHRTDGTSGCWQWYGVVTAVPNNKVRATITGWPSSGNRRVAIVAIRPAAGERFSQAQALVRTAYGKVDEGASFWHSNYLAAYDGPQDGGECACTVINIRTAVPLVDYDDDGTYNTTAWATGGSNGYGFYTKLAATKDNVLCGPSAPSFVSFDRQYANAKAVITQVFATAPPASARGRAASAGFGVGTIRKFTDGRGRAASVGSGRFTTTGPVTQLIDGRGRGGSAGFGVADLVSATRSGLGTAASAGSARFVLTRSGSGGTAADGIGIVAPLARSRNGRGIEVSVGLGVSATFASFRPGLGTAAAAATGVMLNWSIVSARGRSATAGFGVAIKLQLTLVEARGRGVSKGSAVVSIIHQFTPLSGRLIALSAERA